MIKIIITAVVAGILVAWLIAYPDDVLVETGVVVEVEIQTVSGDIFSSDTVITVVMFKDERVVTFYGRIQKIYLNKCNEFWQSYWRETISAYLCK